MGRRLLATALFVGTAASLAGAIGADSGCITVPPSDLPTPAQHRPTILHASVVPPTDEVLTEWPADNLFLVPVELDDTNEIAYYNVFVDFDPNTNSGPAAFGVITPSLATFDAGFTVVQVFIRPPNDNFCHRIEFLVALGFDPSSSHTPNSLGGDIVSWLFNGGGGPNGCPSYEAGTAPDGTAVGAAEELLPVILRPGGEL